MNKIDDIFYPALPPKGGSGGGSSDATTIRGKTVPTPGLSDDEKVLAYDNDINAFKFITPATATRGISLYVDDVLKVETNAISFIAPLPLTIQQVRVSVDVAPVGSGLLIDVNKNGTSIFTTQANRPTIAAGTTSVTSVAPDITALALGDKISIDIDQIGSTTAGENLSIMIICKE